MATRIPGGVRYTGVELGFDARVVAGGATAQGNIVPWRAGYPFDTVILEIYLAAGVVNFIPVIAWVDWDGVTVRQFDRPLLNPGSTTAPWSFWAKDNTPRATSGAVQTLQVGDILGSPYARLGITNSDAAPATFTMEAHLLWSGSER